MADKRTPNDLDHRILANEVQAGDHIYTHIYGGLGNKHGIAIPDKREGIKVVHYTTTVTTSTLSDFADGNHLRLALYCTSKATAKLTRRGTSFSEESMPPENVIDTAIFFATNPDQWRDDSSFFENSSERFAVHCKRKRADPIPVGKEYLKPGDHICTKRCNGTYFHHGIVVPKDGSTQGDLEVVDFSSPRKKFDSKKEATIRRIPLSKFYKDKKQTLYRYSRKCLLIKKPDSPEFLVVQRRNDSEIAENAMYYAFHPEKWESYNIFTNNCEHFAFQMTAGAKLAPGFYQNQVHAITIFFYNGAEKIRKTLQALVKLFRRLPSLGNIIEKAIEFLEENEKKIKDQMTAEKLMAVTNSVIERIESIIPEQIKLRACRSLGVSD